MFAVRFFNIQALRVLLMLTNVYPQLASLRLFLNRLGNIFPKVLFC